MSEYAKRWRWWRWKKAWNCIEAVSCCSITSRARLELVVCTRWWSSRDKKTEKNFVLFLVWFFVKLECLDCAVLRMVESKFHSLSQAAGSLFGTWVQQNVSLIYFWRGNFCCFFSRKKDAQERSRKTKLRKWKQHFNTRNIVAYQRFSSSSHWQQSIAHDEKTPAPLTAIVEQQPGFELLRKTRN